MKLYNVVAALREYLFVRGKLGYVLVALILATLTLFPLLIMLISSLRPASFNPLGWGDFTLDNYKVVFGSLYTYELIVYTFVYAIGSMLWGLCIAVTMSWLVERTDMPFKKLIYVAIFIPMAIPGALAAFGYTFLLNPTNGIFNEYIRSIFGLNMTYGPFNIYGLGGMIFITGLTYAPTMFIMLASVMRNLDPSLEESGFASGANKMGVMYHIVYPILKPGLVSTFIYFLILMVDTLEIPLILGMNANYNVLSLQIFKMTTEGIGAVRYPEYGLSSTYGLIGLIIGVTLLIFYFRMTKQSKQYAVITGKGYKAKEYKLGKLKYLAIGFFVLFFIFKLVLPVAILLWMSLVPYLQAPSVEALSNLTLRNYTALFNSSVFKMAVINTIIMTVSSALLCMGLSTVVSWMIIRGSGFWKKLLDMISFIPHLIPNIIIALSLLLVSVRTPLYGTLSVLIIGYIIRYIPFGVRTMSSVIMQISGELEEAAYASGASKNKVLLKITLPISLPAFVNGVVWVGSHAMRDLTLPILLISTTNLVMSSLFFEKFSTGNSVSASAISVLFLMALLFVVTPIQIILGNRMNRITNRDK